MKRRCVRLLKSVAWVFAIVTGICGVSGADGMRFLLLVDQSPDMATRQLATVQTIYDLVRTGFENQIQPGEKFAVWFYGSRLQTNAPVTWQTGRELFTARQTANLFTGRIYSRLRPREQTLGDAAAIIAASPRITILIFSDGSQPILGTPYDDAMNNAIDQNRMIFMSADRPMIITLLAKNGKLVGGKVHTNVRAQFHIPELDNPSELLNKALEAVRTAPPAKASDASEIDKAREALRDALAGKPKPDAPIPVATMQFAPALKEAPKEIPAPPKEEPKKEELKEEKVAIAPAPIAEPPKQPEQKVEPPPQKPQKPEPKPIEVAAASAPTKQPEPEPKREEPKPQPAPTPTPAKIEEPIKPAVVAQTQSSPPAAKPNPPIQTAAVATSPPAKQFPLPIFIGGLFAIAVGGAVAFRNARRRANSPGSIITQALPRDGDDPWRK